MRTSPQSAADGARRPADAPVVRLDAAEPTNDYRRVGPAGILSTVFHLLLLGLFVWLAPRGQGAGVVERDRTSIVVDDRDELERPNTSSEFPTTPHDDIPVQPSFPDPNVGPTPIFPGQVEPQIGKFAGGLPGWDPPGRPPGEPGFPNVIPGDGPSIPIRPGDAQGRDQTVGGGGGGDIGASRITTDQALKIGVTPAALAAVNKGLKWLASVQSPNGSWKLDGNFPDKGNANDVAGTALGLLPFLGAGKTHVAKAGNLYDKNVDKALQWLIETQDKRTGAFSRDGYSHGLATIAICEAFALSKDYRLRKPAQLAINFTVASQHAGGGWRYSPGQAGDTSVSGWQIMALKSALMAGLDVPSVTIRRAQNFLDEVTDPATEGAGYTGPQPTPTMTSVTLLCRQYLSGWGRQNVRLIKAVDNHVKPNSPRPEKKDVYYYYYATQVMHNFGGDDWKAWNEKMRDQLIASQDANPNQPATYGSWSPAGDQWGRPGGRLMTTSLNLLTLEVYYRYLPLYYREEGAKRLP